jgi:hypothetical protein
MRATTGVREYKESQQRVVPNVADDDRSDHARHEVVQVRHLEEEELAQRVRRQAAARHQRVPPQLTAQRRALGAIGEPRLTVKFVTAPANAAIGVAATGPRCDQLDAVIITL